MGTECILVDMDDNSFVLFVDRRRLDLCVLVGNRNTDGLAHDVPVLNAYMVLTSACSFLELLGDWYIHTGISGLSFCFEFGAFCHIRHHQVLDCFSRLKANDLLSVLAPNLFVFF